MVDEEHANLQSKVFFVWGVFCMISIGFVWAMIYETKGLTLEQVDELYELVDKAWLSKKFRPAVNFRNSVAEGDANMSLRQMSIAQEERRRSQATGVKGDEKGFSA